MEKKYNFLIPIKNKDLIRLGREADGGYVVDKNVVQKTDYLVSFGLGSDWSFELDYIKLNGKVKITMYDHSVSIYPYLKQILKYLRRLITFRSKLSDLKERVSQLKNYLNFLNLSNVNFYPEKIIFPTQNKNDTDIDKVFSRIPNNEKIILKIDIEGGEFKIIDEILKYKSRINKLIFEFHWLNINEDKFIKSVKKIKESFNIIHLHGNNHCEKLSSGLPIALEITFINKEIQKDNGEYVNSFPNKSLDFPNNPYKEDLSFSFSK